MKCGRNITLFLITIKYIIMKLELKHLVGYLPYGLKLKYLAHDDIFVLDVENLSGVMDDIYILGIVKPVLRPLSDLTKEI